MECNSCGRSLNDECEACSKCKQPVCFERECMDEVEVSTGKWVELCRPCERKHTVDRQRRKEDAVERRGDLAFDIWYEKKLKGTLDD